MNGIGAKRDIFGLRMVSMLRIVLRVMAGAWSYAFALCGGHHIKIWPGFPLTGKLSSGKILAPIFIAIPSASSKELALIQPTRLSSCEVFLLRAIFQKLVMQRIEPIPIKQNSTQRKIWELNNYTKKIRFFESSDLSSGSKLKNKANGNNRAPKECSTRKPSENKRKDNSDVAWAMVQICSQPHLARGGVRSVQRCDWTAGYLHNEHFIFSIILKLCPNEVNKR